MDDLQLDETEFGASAPPVPRHFHARGLIALVVQGPIVDENRGRRLTLLPGNVLSLPPGEPHAVSCLTAAARVFTLEAGTGWLAGAFGDGGEFPIDRLRSQEPWVSGAAARLYHRFIRGAVADLELEELILPLFSPPVGASESLCRPAPIWLRRALELVADRAHEPIRMREIATEVGVHAVTLSRSFRSSYGTTMSAFVQKRRLELACVTLANSELSIGAVGLAHGFADHAHFSRTFRRYVGMTPTAYRTALRRGARRSGIFAHDLGRSRARLQTFRASDAGIFAA